MSDLQNRSGCEKTVTKDPETGRTIWRMTNYEAHDVHTYYDTFAWSPDGQKIAFSSVPPEYKPERGVTNTSGGALFIMDADGSNIECLSQEADFNFHTGCFPMWKDSETIVYHGKGGTCIVNIKTKEIREIEGVFSRCLSPDSSKLACQSAGQTGNPGVIVVDLNDFSRQTIVTAEDLREVMLDSFNRADKMPDLDEEKMESTQAQVANIKWSPKGSKLLLRFSYKPGEYAKSLFVVNPDGTELKRLHMVTPYFNHHSWHPDGEHILYNDINENGDGKVYYLVDMEGFNREVLCRTPIGGHPRFNPDGTEIVDFGGGYIWLFIPETGEIRKLASYTNHLHGGLHAHPSWSRDGSQIIYHSDHTGTSQLYVIPVH